MPTSLPLFPFTLLLALLAVACDEDRPRSFATPGGVCRDVDSAGVRCDGQLATTCDGDGSFTSREDCGADDLVCVPDLGCALCEPAQPRCDANTFRLCNGDGSAFVVDEACGPGTFCNPSGCADLCREAAASSSYLGCEYFAVPTANIGGLAAEGFTFSVVIANNQLVDASIEISNSGLPDGGLSRTIPPGDLVRVDLPYVPALSNPPGGDGTWRTEVVPAGAYRITADVPVTAYQFNPLEFQRGAEFSNTNDASLLLPTHVMTGRYLGMTRPTQLLRRVLRTEDGDITADGLFPGFLAIVGVDPEPTEVTVTAAGFVAGAPDGEEGFPALAPGESTTVTLARGEVLQLLSAVPDDCPNGFVEETSDALPEAESIRYCDVGRAYDLTGTRIEADRPVEVLGGHQCTFVPFDRWACDHLEESLFPLETWGLEILVAAPQPVRGEPYLARVISSTDGNRVRSNPSTVGLDVVLDAGEFVEIEAVGDFVVEADAPVMVGQFMVGQDYAGFGASLVEGPDPVGDPSMSMAIPIEQLRPDYGFLTPTTFTQSWITVVASPTATVMLDGEPLDLSTAVPVGDTPFQASRIRIPGGIHDLTSDELMGLVVHGYASYTSFMVPGGLDFEDLGLLR